MMTKITFTFNGNDKKIDAIFINDSESTLKTAYQIKYTNTGHFTFVPNPSSALRSKLAMIVGALNNMEPRNDSQKKTAA